MNPTTQPIEKGEEPMKARESSLIADAATAQSAAAFTPGPWSINTSGADEWSVDYDGYSSSYVTISGKRRAPVAFVVEPSAFGGDVDANARLIAAAPELLEALRPFAAVVARFSDDVATDDTDALMQIALAMEALDVSAFFEARAAIAKATGHE